MPLSSLSLWVLLVLGWGLSVAGTTTLAAIPPQAKTRYYYHVPSSIYLPLTSVASDEDLSHYRGLLIVSDSGNQQLWTVRADGSNRRVLADYPVIREVTWSPDGSTVAFIGGTPDEQQIYLVETGDNNLRPLHTLPASTVSNVRWSPDGNQLFFLDETDPDQHLFQVYIVSFSDGTVIPLSTPRAIINPHWSPDSAEIIYEENGQLFTINPNNGVIDQLTTAPGTYTFLEWADNGNTILTTQTLTQTAIVRLDATGANPTLLTDPADFIRYYGIAPNDHEFVYAQTVQSDTTPLTYLFLQSTTPYTPTRISPPVDTIAPSLERLSFAPTSNLLAYSQSETKEPGSTYDELWLIRVHPLGIPNEPRFTDMVDPVWLPGTDRYIIGQRWVGTVGNDRIFPVVADLQNDNILPIFENPDGSVIFIEWRYQPD